MSAAVEVSRQVLDMFPSVTVRTTLLTGLSSSFILSALFISLPDTNCQGRPRSGYTDEHDVYGFSHRLFSAPKDNPGSNHAVKLTESSHRTWHCDFTFPPCTGNNDVSTCLAFFVHSSGITFRHYNIIAVTIVDTCGTSNAGCVWPADNARQTRACVPFKSPKLPAKTLGGAVISIAHQRRVPYAQ